MSVKGFQIDASINDLKDITLGSPPLADNHVLVYNNTTNQWENQLSAFESGELGITANTEYSAAHSLGVLPKGTQAVVRMGSPVELGYTIGDEAEFMNGDGGSPITVTYKGIYADDTNVYWHTGDALVVTDRNNGNPAAITLANWKIILRAFV